MTEEHAGRGMVARFPVTDQNEGMKDKPTEDDVSVCAGCGGEPAARIDGRSWCVDCFHALGSCCSGEAEESIRDSPSSVP